MGSGNIFFYSLLASWLVSLLAGVKAGGGSQPPLTWHPAGWVAEGVVLQRMGGKFLAGLALCVAGTVAGGWGFVWGGAGIFLLAPLPYLLIDYARRDTRVRSVRRVFFNPLKAVTSQPIKTLHDGRVDERVMKLYFYINDEAWSELSHTMSDPVRQFLENRRIGGGIFEGDADNDFLQVYDSLGLARYLVEPSNETAMVEIARAIGGGGGSARGETEEPLGKGGTEATNGEGEENIITATAALGGTGGGYTRGEKKQTPTGKARSVPLSPPADLGRIEDA